MAVPLKGGTDSWDQGVKQHATSPFPVRTGTASHTCVLRRDQGTVSLWTDRHLLVLWLPDEQSVREGVRWKLQRGEARSGGGNLGVSPAHAVSILDCPKPA